VVREKGIHVWSVNEGEQRFESHTDRLTNYIRFWQADGESQKTSIRSKTALSQMVLEGRFRGGKTPYGYKLEKSGILNKRKHEVNRLVIDEEEAEVVRMMFDLCVSSGYGKFRLAHFLNDHGIRNRQGENWHDATIGAILHNPLYKGILRSGETYSDPFEELQIIKPELFDMAQNLMTERTNENKEYRTMPLNTTGQSLLSGNVFCGHCDGQTGYTMHILDDIVVNILHQVFDKMKSATCDMIVGSANKKQMALLQSDLKRARTENTKANTDYESLKTEVLKAVQGKSALPMEVLNEVLEETRQRVLDTSRRVTELTLELENENSRVAEMQAEFDRIAIWSEIFDSSDIATMKMICGYIIKRVTVYRNYKLDVEFNILSPPTNHKVKALWFVLYKSNMRNRIPVKHRWDRVNYQRMAERQLAKQETMGLKVWTSQLQFHIVVIPFNPPEKSPEYWSLQEI